MDNARLERIEAMLQVALEALCSLAKEVTGKSMVVGFSDEKLNDFGATPLNDHIRWVE